MERDPDSYAIIGAAMEVHRTLGAGFLEPVYQEAFAIELTERAIPYQRELELPVVYKGIHLNTAYRVDFICFERILVELKALTKLSGTEEAQVLNYLNASCYSTALLLNFGTPSLQFQRFVT